MTNNKFERRTTHPARQSSFELLRIVAMLLVLLGHYVPVRMQPTSISAIENPLSTLFELELNSITFVCVNVFVLISGYFSIRPRRESLLRFIAQIFFWAYFTTIVGAILWPSSFNFYDNILNVVVVMRQWFVFAYLGLYLFSPVLNCFIDKANSNSLLKFIGIYYGFSIFFGYICYGLWGSPKDFLEGMSILSLIGLYLVGAYLKKANLSRRFFLDQSAMTYFIIYFCLTVIQTLFAFILLRFNVKSSPYGYLNPIILLESICLFMAFAKLKIKHIKWINYLASSAFAAYLLHCSPTLGTHFTHSFQWIENTFNYPLIIAIPYLVSIYIIAVLIDKVWWKMYDKIINIFH